MARLSCVRLTRRKEDAQFFSIAAWMSPRQTHVLRRARSRAAVRHQRVGGDLPQAAGLVILHRLDQLGARVHDEWPVGSDGLADGTAAEHENIEVGRASFLAG